MNPGTWKISDNEIASEVISAFKWNWQIPSKRVKVSIEDGWLTLEGDLQWNFQREAADKSVSNLFGVRGVTNNITVNSETHDETEKNRIVLALVRNWSVDDDDIRVVVSGPRVSLRGTVRSMYQKQEAERVAWNEPGVWKVENELIIVYND